MLIIFGGLPATGKTTIARELARRLKAVYVRVDTIEQAIKTSKAAPEAGYLAAYKIASDNLAIGNIVIAESVNSIEITRQAWRDVATQNGKKFVEVEVTCSDKEIHKHRLESRILDIAGLENPTWEKVIAREYQPWQLQGIKIDTAIKDLSICVSEILQYLENSP